MQRILAVVCLLLSTHLAAFAAERPNIVFIMADDLGSGDLGCYNRESKIPTPNMDKLASAGMRFTDAHSGSAVCTPTRYGVLTGRYAWRTKLKSGVLWGYSPALIDTNRMTVASMLKKKGYHTGAVGKWHLGLGRAKKTDYTNPLQPAPVDYGFDFFFGIPASLDMEPYVYVLNDRAVEHPTKMVKASGHRRRGGGGFWRGGPIAPGFKHIDVLPVIARQAAGFINKHAQDSPKQPMFLYVPLSAPHTPWLPTDEFRDQSKAGYYGDFTVQVDWTIGQIMATLKANKMVDNTLLFVTSDNGSHWPLGDIKKYDHAANLHYRGQKADIWEGGHRVPFIARWPGQIRAGSVSAQTICLTDLLATAAAVVDTELPPDAAEDSYSILPVLLGKKLAGPIREATVHHSVNGTFAIRQRNWKLILGRGSGGFTKPRVIKPKPGEPKGQLYNLEADPSESENVYRDHPEIVDRLTKLLDQYKKSGRSTQRKDS